MKRKILIAACLVLVLLAVAIAAFWPRVNLIDATTRRIPEVIHPADALTHLPLCNNLYNELLSQYNMELMMENEVLAFFINRETTHFAVVNKADDQVHWSNPTDWDTNPSIRDEILAHEVASIFTLTYFNDTSRNPVYDGAAFILNTSHDYNMMRDSVVLSQFTINEPGESHSMSIVYTVGPDDSASILPYIIRAETFDRLAFESDILTATEIAEIRMFYRLWNMDEINRLGTAIERDLQLARFPNIEHMPIYERRQAPASAQARLTEYMERIGITPELIQYELAHIASPIMDAVRPIFNITIEYTLDGGDLIVRIPKESFASPDNYPLTDIGLLRFFGAVNPGEEGEIFVPDGSGAIINTQRERRIDNSRIIVNVYGNDMNMDTTFLTTEMGTITQPNTMPVFGISTPERGLFGIIESGDAVATITAQAVSPISFYNSVHSSFTLLPTDIVQFGTLRFSPTGTVLARNQVSHDIQVRYTFLSGPNTGYVGMAVYYRNYLQSRGIISRLPRDVEYPFLVEFIGAASRRQSVMGIRVNQTMALTRYTDVINIVERLIADGVVSPTVRYRGWSNHGFFNSYQNNLQTISALGSGRDFGQLVDFMSDNNLGFYPDVNLLYVGHTALFDSFNVSRNASRNINQTTSSTSIVDPVRATYYYNRGAQYVLSPAFMEAMITGILRDAGRLNISALSFGEFGTLLQSDYRRRNEISRAMALDIAMENMRSVSQEGLNMMFDGGLAPYLEYTTFISRMPLSNSMFKVTDHSVPFKGIVLHGFVSFAGESVNVSDDMTMSLLLSAESGAVLAYTWIAADDNLMANTEMALLFRGINYARTYDMAVDNFRRFNSVFSDLHSQTIYNHTIFSDTLVMTEFEYGGRVYVNFGHQEAEINGITIPPRDFVFR